MQTYGRAAGRVRARRGHAALGHRRPASTSTSSAGSRSRRSATPIPRSPTRSPTRRARCSHVSNLYYNDAAAPARRPPRRARSAAAGRVFFSNSGAEANECAIKLARRHGQSNGGPERYHVVSAYGSFHGRTLTTLAATGQPQKQETFQPLPTGLPPRAVRRRRRARRGDGRARVRGAARARAGRGRRAARRRPATSKPCARCATSARRCSSSTRCRPASAGPAAGSASSTPRRPPRRRHDGQGARQRRARSARAGPAPTSPAAFRPGDHATTFGGQPLAARGRARRARRDGGARTCPRATAGRGSA